MVSGVSIAMVSFGVVGIVANIMLFSILCKGTRKKSLFLITIFSLGVADFLVSLILLYSGLYFICQEMKVFTVSQLFMGIFLGNLTFCQTSSFLHVLLITTERLLAVFHPLRFRRFFTRKICAILIITVWAVPFPLSFVHHGQLKYVFKPVALVSSVFLISSYSAICVRLIRQDKSVIVRASSKKTNRPFKVAAHALVVTFAFLICTLPYLFATEEDTLFTSAARLLMVSNVLINPVVYVLFAHCRETIRSQSLTSISHERSRKDTDHSSKKIPKMLHDTGAVIVKDDNNQGRAKVGHDSIETEGNQCSTR